MQRRLQILALLAVSLFCASRECRADNWPRFRGPNGSGCSDVTGLPVAWTDADYVWKVDLPGEGISSPVIWGNKLFITSADADAGKRWLLCYDADTGKSLWSREYPFAAHKKHNANSYATSTPAADGEHVYALWQSREQSALVALDHNGQDVWKFEFEKFQGGHGGGISPIVYDGLVIVANEQEGPSYLVALDATSGKERWRTERSTERASYATPCVFERPDSPAEIIFTEWKQGITSVDAKTGRKIWEIGVFGDTTERAVSSPIVAGDLVIGTCGFVTGNKHTVAVRPPASGTDALPREVYRIERQVSYLPTSLVHADWLFSWSEQGIVSCYNVTTGEQVWQKRVGGKFSSSPVCAGNVLYNVDEAGTVTALSATATFQELGRSALDDTCRSTPAIARGKLYLRTNSHLFAVGSR
jgi:outer membrane protein assembly factor BamB